MPPSNYFKIYFNIILPSTSGYSNWLFPSSLPTNPVPNKPLKGCNSSCVCEQHENSQIAAHSRVVSLSMLQCQHSALCVHLSITLPVHVTGFSSSTLLVARPICVIGTRPHGQQQFRLSQRRQKRTVSDVEDNVISVDAMKVYGLWRYSSTQFFR
jgi:hypothetical protein